MTKIEFYHRILSIINSTYRYYFAQRNILLKTLKEEKLPRRHYRNYKTFMGVIKDYKNVFKNSIPSCNVFLGLGVVYNVNQNVHFNFGISGSNQILLKKLSDNYQPDRFTNYGIYSGLTFKF